ncbi:unnamed protein product [Cuscuta europaea]|uniref:F-box domain-containing protein n=1 Tax=Cuscuta europaea TaxID=41803 RepID=A0A9P1E4V7_CUSEU|nr:unnamed protein product [Cuscuta europaea]
MTTKEIRAENVEMYSEENGRANKRIKDLPIDRLSELPDSLLIHILSFLGVKHAAMTSLLGKKWKFLWAELPTLEFEFYFWDKNEKPDKILNFVDGVNKTLATRSENYLEKLKVVFKYRERFAQDVDNWLEFALKSKVKDIHLSIIFSEEFYTLLELMYSNSSLTSLSLRGCILDPTGTIQWSSLTKLQISEVDLPQPVVEKILSGCPVLNYLQLCECWGFTCLSIASRNLCKLWVQDPESEETKQVLQISAPYVKSLILWVTLEETQLKLINISSAVDVLFCFTGFLSDLPSDNVLSNTKEFFQNIQHITKLRLGPGPVKALAALVLDGWQLPQNRLRCLTIDMVCDAAETIPGILGLLEASPHLDKLIIDSIDPYVLDEDWVPPAKGDLDCDLLHLKTIRMSNLANPNLGGEPMLTLARIFLKRATALEEMRIWVNIDDTNEFIKIGQTLLTYPVSSPNAVILLP